MLGRAVKATERSGVPKGLGLDCHDQHATCCR